MSSTAGCRGLASFAALETAIAIAEKEVAAPAFAETSLDLVAFVEAASGDGQVAASTASAASVEVAEVAAFAAFGFEASDEAALFAIEETSIGETGSSGLGRC